MGAYDCDCMENLLSERKNRLDNGNCSEKPNNSKLRPCPFCGKEAKVYVYGHAAKTRRMDGEEPYFAATYRIGCFDCGVVYTHESQFETKEDGDIKVVVDGYKAAADKWNRRVE